MMDDDSKVDGAYTLAILYTIGYLATIGALLFFEIPTNNREILLQLFGIMSAAQLGIIKHYYDGTKAAQQAQQVNNARSAKTDIVLQDIAKTAPATAAAVVAAAAGTPVTNGHTTEGTKS